MHTAGGGLHVEAITSLTTAYGKEPSVTVDGAANGHFLAALAVPKWTAPVLTELEWSEGWGRLYEQAMAGPADSRCCGCRPNDVDWQEISLESPCE
jgi:hypothetical protein